jgi:hypothetical protein
MATLDEIRLQQLLGTFEQQPQGIATLSQAASPLAFRYVDQLYPQYGSADMGYAIGPYGSPDFGYAIGPYATPDSFLGSGFSGTPDMNFPSAPANRLGGLDLKRFQGVSDMSIIDETTNDEQDQNYIDQVSKNKSTGIMDLIMSIVVPGYGFLKNIGRGGLEGIRSLNQRIQGSDFGQAKSIADYLDMRKYGGAQGRRDASARTMTEARGLQKQIDQRPSAIGGGGGGGGRDMGASASRSAAATRSKDLGSMRGGVGR